MILNPAFVLFSGVILWSPGLRYASRARTVFYRFFAWDAILGHECLIGMSVVFVGRIVNPPAPDMA
ncbi:MAG: hypothetical protein Q8M58_00280 [Anaerolineales bacterium]|nr:hypothetical protein [Anaerolineales bacterium]